MPVARRRAPGKADGGCSPGSVGDVEARNVEYWFFILLALLTACAPIERQPRPAPPPGQDRVPAPAQVGAASSTAPDPTYAALPIPEKLHRTLAAPGTRAMLEGHTGMASSQVVADQTATYGRHVTDVPFSVRAVYSRRPTPYVRGALIALRLPGEPAQPPPAPGRPQPMVKEVDGPEPPRLEAGRDYFVLARDVGVWAGGTTDSVVVLTSPVDAFLIGADGLVHGQGPWADFTEPLDAFRRRLSP